MEKENKPQSEDTNSPSTTAVKRKFRPNLKKVLLALIIVAVGVGGYFLAFKYRHYFVVARVGNTFISRYELNDKLVEMYGSQAMEDMITEKLVEKELEKNNISISEEELNAEIEEIKASLSGMDLEQALSSQNMTMEDLRKQIVLQLGIEKLLGDTVKVSAEELDEFLTTYGEQLQGETDEEKREEAIEILRQRALQTEVLSWIEKLKSESSISRYLE